MEYPGGAEGQAAAQMTVYGVLDPEPKKGQGVEDSASRDEG